MANKLNHWHNSETFSLVDAALLIVEKYPEEWANEDILFNNPPEQFMAVLGLMLDDAVDVLNEAVESQEKEGQYYTEYRLNTTKPENLKELEKRDGLKYKSTKYDLKKWLKVRRIDARFFDNDSLEEFEVSETQIPTIKSDSPFYPHELVMAINAWVAVTRSESKGKPKARIKKWLEENYKTDKNLSNEAKERIATLVNWDKKGGASKTE